MSTSVEERVLRVFGEVFALEQASLSPEISIIEDLEATSLDQMTLFVALEEEFDKSIEPEEVAEIDTVRDVITFIATKLELEES